MAGIYLHIPFCKKRCNYCDFYSTIKNDIKNKYLKALINEIEIQEKYLENDTVETIYFGGGTPSVLKTNEIGRIIKTLKKHFIISENSENTIEVNPDDNRKDYFESIKSNGINRISIGVQSFDDITLKLLGRRHTAKQVYKSIEDAATADIKNLSIDLIFGLPGMNNKIWESTLEKAFKLPVQHLSAYHLTYEKGTVLYKKLMKGKLSTIIEDESWEQFEILHYMAKDNNFDHYEISNFAKKGFYSKHNSNYWNGTSYLGLGPSAHSFNGHMRQWNCSNLNKYIQLINSHKLFYKCEILSKTDKANEYLLTGLRTSNGIDFNEFRNKFGKKSLTLLYDKFEKYLISRHARKKNNFGFLTLKGWFISDKIIADLMITNPI